jgi:mRNA interferase MazF
MKDLELKKGEIYYADLNGAIGCEQSGIRPVLIIQNDIGNKYSPTTIVAAITSNEKRTEMPTHIGLNSDCGLPLESIVMLEQVRTIDRKRIKCLIGSCNKATMDLVNRAIKASFFMTDKEGE